MNRKFAFALIMILVSAFAFILFAFERDSIYMHELVHQDIYRNYGINSSISFVYKWDSIESLYFGGQTTGNVSQFNGTKEEYRTMENLHSINEAIGYNLSGIQNLLMIIALLLFANLIIKCFPQ